MSDQTPSALPRSAPSRQTRSRGVALVTVLIFSVVLMAILSAYLTLTLSESRTARASFQSVQGFFAAEGGLNMRAELVRAKFQGYLRPLGSGPGPTRPCTPGNVGSGDMACLSYSLNGRTVMTYLQDTTDYDAAGNPESGTVGPGDTYAGLNYAQYRYLVRSEALNPVSGAREAVLEMQFQSRLVPLFQFAAFYQNDLELHPGPAMTLNGRVHTNANLYLNAETGLSIGGKTTAVGDILRGGKDGRGCGVAGVSAGPVSFSGTPMDCPRAGATTPLSDVQLGVFSGEVLAHQQALTVPSMSTLDPDPTGANNSELWARADLRVVAVKEAGGFSLRAVNRDGSTDAPATAALAGCDAQKPPALQLRVGGFWDNRENKFLTLLDVDQTRLMDCVQLSGAFHDPAGRVLKVDDLTGGGLVWHFSFQDERPETNQTPAGGAAGRYVTPYAVMLHDAARLGTSGNSPPIKGLTVVSNQPVFTRGDYNATDKKPAAILGDAINVLSNAVSGDIPYSYPGPGGAPQTGLPGPVATPTTVNAALLSGVDDTLPGTGYNGGLQNYPRFHEDWTGVPFSYRGSFVSLGRSSHVNGPQSKERYAPPDRAWDYDQSFNDANNLPPLTPRFVYLRQLLFARSW